MNEDLETISALMDNFSKRWGKEEARGVLRIVDAELSKKKVVEKEIPKVPTVGTGGGHRINPEKFMFELFDEFFKDTYVCPECVKESVPTRKLVLVEREWLENLTKALALSNKKSVNLQTEIHHRLGR